MLHRRCGRQLHVLHAALLGMLLNATAPHFATHGDTLQHTASHCNTLQHTSTPCNTLQHTATHRNTPQHTATHRNTPQHTSTHGISQGLCELRVSAKVTECTHAARPGAGGAGCDVLDGALLGMLLNATVTHCNTYCKTLQHTATHCNTLNTTGVFGRVGGGGWDVVDGALVGMLLNGLSKNALYDLPLFQRLSKHLQARTVVQCSAV